MARIDERTLRNDADGLTWKVLPRGRKLAIEMVFDDEPTNVVKREVILAPEKVATGLAELIAEQLASGFVMQPSWVPTPEWIRAATDNEISLEISDPWIIDLHTDTTLWDRAPASVRSYAALYTLIVQSNRNGLSSFLVEDDPRYIAHVSAAAREVGLDEIGRLFAKATAGMDLDALARRGVGVKVRYGSPAAAKQLEQLASTLEPGDRLIAWIRERAEDFSTIATLRRAQDIA